MRISGPGPHDVVLELPPDRVGDACAIGWSQPRDGALWRLDVDVVTRAGRRRLGQVSPLPRGGARIVAIASCPGAIGWTVTATGPAGASAELELAASPPTEAMAPGVVELDGAGRPAPRSPARAFRPAALTGGALISAEPARLERVRGFMDAAPGFVQVWASALPPSPGDVPSRIIAAAAGAPFELVDGGVYEALAVTISSTPLVHTPGPLAWLEVDFE